MSEAFDPYRKWLGIPPEEQPPHHYRLLGIANFEDDPDVIENAADRQMSHVRTFQSGKHSAASQKILNELAAAKLLLLNEDKRSAYDHELREKLGLNGQQTNSSPAAPVPRRPSPTDRPSGDAPLAPSPSKPVASVSPPVAPATTKAPPKKTATPETSEKPEAKSNPLGSTGPILGGSTGSSTARSRTRRKKSSQAPLIAAGVVGAVLLLGCIVAVAMMSGNPDNSQVQREVNSSSRTEDPDNKPKPKPTRPKPPRNNSPKTGGGTNDDDPKDPKDVPESGFPTPGSDVPPPEPSQDPAALVADARTALKERDLDTARSNLESAEKSDVDVEFSSEIRQLSSLATYLDEFWIAVQKGVDGLKSGESVKVGDLDYVLSEVNGDEVTYQAGGAERTSKVMELPALVAVAFAEQALEEDPFGNLYISTFHALDGDGDSAQRREWAKDLWIQDANEGNVDRVLAKELGIDPAPYLRGLGSQPQTADTRRPVPTGKELGDGRLKLRRVYSDDFARVRTTPDGRKDFFKKLVLAAREEEDPVMQYVMYEELTNLTTEIPNVNAALLAVEETAENFEIDALREKQIVLGKCLASADANVLHEEIFLESRRLFTMALDQNEYKVAASLGRTAERAARKARNFPAAEAAAAEVERIEDRVKQQEIAERAMEKLKEVPGDQKANTLLGTYRCFYEEKWDEGLDLLAKGEPPLSELAKLELSSPSKKSDRLKIAEAWLMAAKREKGDAETSLLRHARSCFEFALEKLGGEEKETVEATISEIDKMLADA